MKPTLRQHTYVVRWIDAEWFTLMEREHEAVCAYDAASAATGEQLDSGPLVGPGEWAFEGRETGRKVYVRQLY